MKVHRLIFGAILLPGIFQEVQVLAQKRLIIELKSSGEPGKNVKLFVYEGFYPSKETYAVSLLDEMGFCRFTVPMQGSYRKFEIRLGKKKCIFIGKAGDTLQVKRAGNELVIVDPFISYTALERAIRESDKLNNEILMTRKKKAKDKFREYRDRVLLLEEKAAQHENPYFRNFMRFYLYELRLTLSMWAYKNPEALYFFRETDTLIRNSEPMPWLSSYRHTVHEVVKWSVNFIDYQNECSEKHVELYRSLLCQAERFSHPKARETAKVSAFVCALSNGWFERKSKLFPSFDSLRKVLETPVLKRAADKLNRQHFAVSEGDKFPNFSLANSEGDTLRLHDIEAEVILIDFWATWCGPCVSDMKKLKELKEKYNDRLAIVSICSSDTFERMQDFVKKKGYPWHFVFDTENSYNDRLGVGALPTYFILDDKHRLLLQPNIETNLKKEVEKLMKE